MFERPSDFFYFCFVRLGWSFGRGSDYRRASFAKCRRLCRRETLSPLIWIWRRLPRQLWLFQVSGEFPPHPSGGGQVQTIWSQEKLATTNPSPHLTVISLSALIASLLSNCGQQSRLIIIIRFSVYSYTLYRPCVRWINKFLKYLNLPIYDKWSGKPLYIINHQLPSFLSAY